MNILLLCAYLLRAFLQFVVVQLFLTLISLPFLIAWGIPLSWVTSFGTVIFTPVLTVYLWCACAVFITTLCNIPNSWCVYALQQVSAWWLWALSLLKQPWDIGFVRPSLLVLCAIPLSACVLVYSMRYRQTVFIACILGLLLCGWIVVLRVMPVCASAFTIPHEQKKEIQVIHNRGVTTVIDMEGCLNTVVDGSSKLLYTIMPEITALTGASYIDCFVVVHPRQRVFEALTVLCTKGTVHDVCVPIWSGHIPLNAWRAYKKLERTLAAYGRTLWRVHKTKPYRINDTCTLVMTASPQKYGDATYNLCTVVNTQSDEIKG